mmetsp:Transcript_50666/g.146078  ORF Transcript_50666/g.146078 Transcript_50666/m.146078 type:complete len:206 (-) Transcript_50666:1282-1899(-)
MVVLRRRAWRLLGVYVRRSRLPGEKRPGKDRRGAGARGLHRGRARLAIGLRGRGPRIVPAVAVRLFLDGDPRLLPCEHDARRAVLGRHVLETGAEEDDLREAGGGRADRRRMGEGQAPACASAAEVHAERVRLGATAAKDSGGIRGRCQQDDVRPRCDGLLLCGLQDTGDSSRCEHPETSARRDVLLLVGGACGVEVQMHLRDGS